MSTTRNQLIKLIEQGTIPVEKVSEALKVTHIQPNEKDWRHFIDLFLLSLGGLALAFSLIFFIAYNWNEIGRYAKFGLVEVAMVLAITVYWRFNKHAMISKISLLCASILLGVLMAFYGQTYQTGADPWQLFFNWALLMLPWAFISRFAALWLVWLGLINTAIILYHQAFPALHWFLIGSDSITLWQFFIFNTLALIIWELLAKSKDWLAKDWAIRLVAVASGLPITWLAVGAAFNHENLLALVVWLVSLSLLYFYYRKIKPDLFMLAGGCLSAIFVTMAFLIDITPNSADQFFILSLSLIAMGGAATAWLKKVHQELSS